MCPNVSNATVRPGPKPSPHRQGRNSVDGDFHRRIADIEHLQVPDYLMQPTVKPLLQHGRTEAAAYLRTAREEALGRDYPYIVCHGVPQCTC